MRYGSVCSGIEAATVAWHGLGWEPQWFSEIEQFPSAVLNHHYPNIPNYGDMTKYKDWTNDSTVDLLVGGTPCQSFSVAGLRQGLEDPRGNLSLTFIAMAERLKPKWIVWENVPGVLSSNRGRDFGSFLSALGNIGYGWSYRILDSQYFGVPQRRRRVFVVGCLGDWRSASEVLLKPESVSGNPPPCRETEQRVTTKSTQGSPLSSTEVDQVEIDTCYTSSSFGAYREGIGTVRASGGDLGGGSETLTVRNTMGTITSRMFNALGVRDVEEGALLPVGRQWPSDVAATLNACYADKCGLENQHVHNGASHFVETLSRVRRLTPVECERLQGFPDNYTQIPYRNRKDVNCPVGPRYKALGNSMTVNVMKWIGEQINEKGI